MSVKLGQLIKKMLMIVAFSILLVACEKSISQTSGDGVLRDLSELDGCGWVIELNPRSDSNERLEPLYLNDFDIKPIDGMSEKSNTMKRMP